MVTNVILTAIDHRQGKFELPQRRGESDMHNQDQASADALPRALVEHLAELGVDSALRTLVVATSAQRSVTSHVVKGDYVAISPGAGGHIASYVHQHRLTLALPPRRADLVGVEHGWDVSPDSGITSYVHIPASSLGSGPQRSVVLALLLESLDWRAAGPSQNSIGGKWAAAPASSAGTCKIHFTQMLGGKCDQCD